MWLPAWESTAFICHVCLPLDFLLNWYRTQIHLADKVWGKGRRRYVFIFLDLIVGFNFTMSPSNLPSLFQGIDDGIGHVLGLKNVKGQILVVIFYFIFLIYSVQPKRWWNSPVFVACVSTWRLTMLVSLSLVMTVSSRRVILWDVQVKVWMYQSALVSLVVLQVVKLILVMSFTYTPIFSNVLPKWTINLVEVPSLSLRPREVMSLLIFPLTYVIREIPFFQPGSV